MATRAITTSARNTFRRRGSTAVALAASDDTSPVFVGDYNTMTALAVTASFGTGNITLTAQGSIDGTNWVTLGSATTITADGAAYNLGSASTQQDIRTYNFVRWIRGGDANVGTVNVQFALSK